MTKYWSLSGVGRYSISSLPELSFFNIAAANFQFVPQYPIWQAVSPACQLFTNHTRTLSYSPHITQNNHTRTPSCSQIHQTIQLYQNAIIQSTNNFTRTLSYSAIYHSNTITTDITQHTAAPNISHNIFKQHVNLAAHTTYNTPYAANHTWTLTYGNDYKAFWTPRMSEDEFEQ